MFDKHRYDLPVIAFNDKEAIVYDSRKKASEKIHEIRGCSESTADKEIREAIYNKNTIYGYQWRYKV